MKNFAWLLLITGTWGMYSCKDEPGKGGKTPVAEEITFPELKQKIMENPDSPQLVDALIDSLDRSGEFGEAAAWADTLVARDPVNNLMYLVLKGDLLRSNNQYAEAAKAYERYLELRPDEESVEMALANVLAEGGDARTLSLANALEKRYPSRNVKTALHYIKGVYYNTIKEYPSARIQLDSAIKRDYTFANAYYEKGFSWYDEKNYAEAIRTFEKMVEIATKDPEGWYWLGKSHEAAGDKNEAIVAYQRALMLKNIPEASEAIERLSR